MTLNVIMAVVLQYLTEIGSFGVQLRHKCDKNVDEKFTLGNI